MKHKDQPLTSWAQLCVRSFRPPPPSQPGGVYYPSTHHQFVAGQHDIGEEYGTIPSPQTEGRESEPYQCGIGDVPAAHCPALPHGGDRVQEREGDKYQADGAQGGVKGEDNGIASGAATNGSVRAPRLVAAVIPTGEGNAATHGGPVDGAKAHPAVMAEAVAAFVEGGDGPGGCVARDPGDVAVGDSPVGGDEALLLACGPVRCGGRHGSTVSFSPTDFQ